MWDMLRWRWVWFALLLALVGCGSDAGTPGTIKSGSGIQNSLGLTKVVIDDAHASKANVGNQGGTVVATGADGTVYTLAIPAQALLTDTEIGLYPIMNLEGLPATPNLVGVHCTPEGLQFLLPARLTIQLRPGLAANSLVGVAYSGDGADLHNYPVTASGNVLSIAVLHFSGCAAGEGFPTTLAGTTAESQAVSAIAGATYDYYNDLLSEESLVQEIATRIQQWYSTGLRARLEAIPFMPDQAEVNRILDEYVTFRHYASGGVTNLSSIDANITSLCQSVLLESTNLAGVGVRKQFELSNQVSLTQDNVEEAESAMRWYVRGRDLHLDTVANRLDLAKVVQDLHLKIVFAEQSFPTTIDHGTTGTLRLKVGYQIGNGPQHFFERTLAILVAAQNGTVTGPPEGETDESGEFTTTILRGPDGELRIDIGAGFDTGPLSLVSANAFIVRGTPPDPGQTILGGYVGQHQGISDPKGVNQQVPPGPIVVNVLPIDFLNSLQVDFYLSDFDFQRQQQGIESRFMVFVVSDPDDWTKNGNTLTAHGRISRAYPGTGTFTGVLQGNQLTGTLHDNKGVLMASFTTQRQ